jgi:DUF1680 family protein
MKKSIFLSIVLPALLSIPVFGQITSKVEDQQFPLPSNSIRLSGLFENDIQNSMEHWNKGVVPYAKFVEFFRSGRPQFALGEMWGKSVRSGSMLYRYSQDAELKRILEATIKDILSTQQSNGSISCVPVEKQPDDKGGDLWERRYVMLGMEEYYEWVNQDPAVLESLIKQADCILSQIGDPPKTSILDLGWSATNIGYEPCHIESSTLLEPFVRLYNRTGQQRFLDFAAYIVKSGGTKHYNVFEQAYNNVEPHKMAGHYPKSYEMLALFEGLVAYYRVVGEPYWKQAALNLYNNIRDHEITLIGSGGADQPYHPKVAAEAWDNTAFEQTNPDVTRMNETCTGISWLKYCSTILRLTGDSRAVDEMERYIYNSLHGIQKPSGDGCCVYSFMNGKKIKSDGGWGWNFEDGLRVTCCNLNVPAGLAYLPYIAVTNCPKGPVVNLFMPANVDLTTPGQQPLKLAIDTEYPASEKVVIRVNPEKAETFTLKLRIPAWSANTAVKINGKKQTVTAGQYAELSRTWKSGDRIEISLDMQCRVIDAPHGSNPKGDHFQAVSWGPLVLTRTEHIDPAYNQPVTLKAGKDGLVKITRVKPTHHETQLEFLVPTTTGTIRMVDYGSVNGWEDAHVCTWLPENENQK